MLRGVNSGLMYRAQQVTLQSWCPDGQKLQSHTVTRPMTDESLGPLSKQDASQVSWSKSIREWLWLRNEQIGEHLVTIARTALRNLEGSRLPIWAASLSQRLAARGLCAEVQRPICDHAPRRGVTVLWLDVESALRYRPVRQHPGDPRSTMVSPTWQKVDKCTQLGRENAQGPYFSQSAPC